MVLAAASVVASAVCGLMSHGAATRATLAVVAGEAPARWRRDLALAATGLTGTATLLLLFEVTLGLPVHLGLAGLAVLAVIGPTASLAARGGTWKLAPCAGVVAIGAALQLVSTMAAATWLVVAAFLPLLFTVVTLAHPSSAGRTPFAGGGGPREPR